MAAVEHEDRLSRLRRWRGRNHPARCETGDGRAGVVGPTRVRNPSGPESWRGRVERKELVARHQRPTLGAKGDQAEICDGFPRPIKLPIATFRPVKGRARLDPMHEG